MNRKRKPYSVVFIGPSGKPRQVIVLAGNAGDVGAFAERHVRPGERIVIQEGQEPTHEVHDAWSDTQLYAGFDANPAEPRLVGSMVENAGEACSNGPAN